jgi:hypothetical protein
MMMFPQRMQGKKANMHPWKKGMGLYKKCLKYIETQQPNLSRDKLHDVLKSMYEENYSGSDRIVLYYQKLIRSPDFSQEAGVREMHAGKVLKVYYKLLKFWKASDQGRTPRLIPEQNEESNEKVKKQIRDTSGEPGDVALHISTCEELLYHVKYTN